MLVCTKFILEQFRQKERPHDALTFPKHHEEINNEACKWNIGEGGLLSYQYRLRYI